jgi:hypothetical protein
MAKAYPDFDILAQSVVHEDGFGAAVVISTDTWGRAAK